MSGITKIWRFIGLYGPGRTAYKVVGRLRRPVPLVWRRFAPPDIAMIGCGQYGFASLGYFLTRRFGRRIRWCFDTVPESAQTMARTQGAQGVAESAEQAISDAGTAFVYIASNHASHTNYAVQALAAGKTVFVEKPISVTPDQLARLHHAAKGHETKIFAGYNRPHSKAVRGLKGMLTSPKGGLSLSCFVSGHVIGPDHWYRKPEEGTRICGNAGHWIDLFTHMLAWRGSLPDQLRINLVAAKPDEGDDNFALTVATDQDDVFTLMLTARNEPFEGINETVNVQWDDVIAKVDDFRWMTVWRGASRKRTRFWPKDVGHRAGALQPFETAHRRPWSEVIASSVLMLEITEMVRTGDSQRTLSWNDALQALDKMDPAP